MNNKGSFVLVGVLAFLVVGALGGGYWYAAKSPTRVAFLNVESEAVQVDTGAGWQPAQDNMNLGLDDKVKTVDGEASLIIHESVIVALEPNSEIAIKDLDKDHVKVDQSSGSAWSKFTGLTGIDAFSVETPATVATVRGTEFQTTIESVVVSEGKVEVTTKDGQTFLVEQGFKLIKVGDTWTKVALTESEREEIVAQMQKMLNRLKELRWAEIHKKETLYSLVKSMYGLTDDGVQEYLDQADRGEFDLDEVEQKSPIKSEVVTKVKALTEKIIEQVKAIASMSAA